MNKKDKSLDYTCIFGGGAIRGVSYAGSIKALEELNVQSNNIAGSSVGAIFAGLFALGYNADELREIFMHVNHELFRDIHFGFGKDFALSKGEIFLDWVRELIEKRYYGENYVKGENPPVTFADLEKNLVIITTDLTNFKYKEFSKSETPNVEIAYAIRISSTMPGLMKPVEQNGALLVDGDLQKSWPLWKLSKNLCPYNERILEFRLEGDYEGKGQNAIDFMNTVYSCVTSFATDFIIDTYGDRDKFDYIKINTGAVVVVDFNLSRNKRKELMDIGYHQTMEYFNQDLKIKKNKLVKHYKKIYQHIAKIKKFIFANKIKPANNELAKLYMNIYPSKKYIDLKYYDMIEEFKKLFLANLISLPLFGKVSLKDFTLVKSKINLIAVQFEKVIIELENYCYDL